MQMQSLAWHFVYRGIHMVDKPCGDSVEHIYTEGFGLGVVWLRPLSNSSARKEYVGLYTSPCTYPHLWVALVMDVCEELISPLT